MTTVIIRSGDSHISSGGPLADYQRHTILADANAMKALPLCPDTLPEGENLEYLRLWYAETFAGLILLEHKWTPELNFPYCEHHLLLRTQFKHAARQLCELSLVYTRAIKFKPSITFVNSSPEFQYMHNFLRKLGYTTHPKEYDGRTMYMAQDNWKPKFLKEVEITWLHQ